MAWSNLSGSQMVSFTDAQTSGFALKQGQSHATSLQCMTKAEILAKYTLDIGTTYGNPYADNQLVPVVDWIPKGTGYCPSLTDLSSITSNFVGSGGYGTWYFTFTYIGTLTTTATLWYRTRRDGVYTPNQFYPPFRYTATFSPGSTHTLTGGSTQSPATYLEFEAFECNESIIAPYVYYVNYDTEQGTTAGYATACAFGPATYPVYTNASSLSGIGSGTVIYQDPYGYPYYSGGVTRWLAIGATENGSVTRALQLNINAVVQQNVDCSTPPPVYYNTQQSGTATRNNCSAEYTGGSATLTVLANTYSSSTSVEDANNQAIAYIDANKQAYANANGTCTPICTSYTHIASRDGTIYWTSCSGTPSSRSTSRFGSYTVCALTGTNTGGAGQWSTNGVCTISTPINCEVTEWSDWSECVNGSQTRTRTVTTPASGGGTACPTLSETVTCPVDCVVSDWSNWSECIAGQHTRTRTVVVAAQNGGTACPVLTETESCTSPCKEYIVTNTNDPNGVAETVFVYWTDCFGNTQSDELAAGAGRTFCALQGYYEVTQGGAINLVGPCTPTPVNCVVSEWSLWSECIDGVETRTRIIITPASGGTACPTLTDTRECSAPLPRTANYYYDDPCGSQMILWYAPTEGLFYTTETGSTLYTGLAYTFMGANQFDFDWEYYSMTQGSASGPYATTAPCSGNQLT